MFTKHGALEVIACGLNQYQSNPEYWLWSSFIPTLDEEDQFIAVAGALAGDGTTWQVRWGRTDDLKGDSGGFRLEIETYSDHSAAHSILIPSSFPKCQTSLPAPLGRRQTP